MAIPNLWLIFILQSTITLRSFSPLTFKTSRSETAAENFIRPQLRDLIFCTGTFHPFSRTSLQHYSFFPRSALHSLADLISKFLFLESKWNYFRKSNSEEVVSLLVQPYLSRFPSNATHQPLCFGQVLIAKTASEFCPGSAKPLRLNTKAQMC